MSSARSHYASANGPGTSSGGHASHTPSRTGPPGSTSTATRPPRTSAQPDTPQPTPSQPLTGPHAALLNLKPIVAEGHTGPLKAVSWNSTGSRIGTASSDRTVRVWYPERFPDPRSRSRSTGSGYTWELKGHTASVEAISWDPTHSDRLASASLDRMVKVWEYRMLRQLFTVELGSPVLHVQYSPDGKFLAAGSKDETISIIEVSKQKVIHSWQESETSIHEIVWSHAGTLICLATQQGTVKIYETEGWRFMHEIEGNTSSVFCLEFDPLGRYLAVGGADAVVSLWSLSDWICVRTFAALTQPIRSLSFSYDGRYLASGSEDGFIDISDVESGEQVHTISVNATTTSLAFHPNKLSLAVASEEKTLKLYQ